MIHAQHLSIFHIPPPRTNLPMWGVTKHAVSLLTFLLILFEKIGEKVNFSQSWDNLGENCDAEKAKMIPNKLKLATFQVKVQWFCEFSNLTECGARKPCWRFKYYSGGKIVTKLVQNAPDLRKTQTKNLKQCRKSPKPIREPLARFGSTMSF